jgi:hypothetical protein
LYVVSNAYFVLILRKSFADFWGEENMDGGTGDENLLAIFRRIFQL